MAFPIDPPTLRQQLPTYVLSYLPISLVFPVAWMYAGFILFLLTFAISGEWQQKWKRLRQHPMLFPIGATFIVSVVALLFQGRFDSESLSGFLHYQIYVFLLAMLAVGSGPWQQRAVYSFFVGALIAASLFFLATLNVLPENTLFRSYIVYQGNKSILLGLLLAIAATWMVHDYLVHRNYSWWRLTASMFVVAALFIGSKSRTAGLLFFVLLLVVAFGSIRFRWWYCVVLLMLISVIAAGLYQASHQPAPITCLAKEMHDRYQMSGLEILKNRSICTVQQIRDFGKSGNVSEDGMRLQIYSNTWELIQQAPWTGHGISQWLPRYQEKAKGSISEKMTTPHNDYLLYWCELGIFGLASLLLIWIWQLRAAYIMKLRMDNNALPVFLVTVSMIFAGAFNAILRDALFGLAMLILLAIPLASYDKQRPVKVN